MHADSQRGLNTIEYFHRFEPLCTSFDQRPLLQTWTIERTLPSANFSRGRIDYLEEGMGFWWLSSISVSLITSEMYATRFRIWSALLVVCPRGVSVFTEREGYVEGTSRNLVEKLLKQICREIIIRLLFTSFELLDRSRLIQSFCWTLTRWESF